MNWLSRPVPVPPPAGPPPAAAETDTLPAMFEELYHQQLRTMVRLAVLLVDETAAEDVVHDAFAALWTRWPQLRDQRAAIGYLRVCVVNGARGVLRRRRTARAYLLPRAGTEPGSDHALMLAAQHREVIDALAALPPRQREVLVLRYWAELSQQEIAEAMGVSLGTVKSSTNRGLHRLESMLQNTALSAREPR